MSDEGAPSDEHPPVTFNVKSSSDAKYTLTLPLTTTSVLDLKNKLAGSDYADTPADRQRLIYSGRVLKNSEMLSAYKIADGHTIHLVKSAQSNQRQNPANQGASTAGTPATGGAGAQGIPGVPTNFAAGTGNNPLAGLTGARYAGFAQLPGAGMFGPDGGMGPPPDPEQMLRMMRNPQFQSTMNEALQNPALIDMMIQQNPVLRDMGPGIRQMIQSPEFRRMMTDPDALQAQMNMQRALGIDPFGGGAGPNAFPAPGATNTTESNAATTANQTDPTSPPPNPFAALFGNPQAAGGTPLASPPPPGSAAPPHNAPADANPFAALFDPALLAALQHPEAHPSTGSDPSRSPPPNPLASPLFQNPELLHQALAAFYPQNANPSGTDSNLSQPQVNPLLAQLIAGMGQGAPGSPPPPADTRPPEERYADQLRQLNDMGFYDFDQNVTALRRSGGSVQGAVEYLLSHP